MVFLLRHASAGERLGSPSLDRSRALDESGRVDAARLASMLAPFVFQRIVSSPLARCVETVEPVAARLGLGIELRDELAPGAAFEELTAMLDEVDGRQALACTHREAFEILFPPSVRCEKGGGWLIERGPRRWRAATYLAAPTGTPPLHLEPVLAGS